MNINISSHKNYKKWTPILIYIWRKIKISVELYKYKFLLYKVVYEKKIMWKDSKWH
jgi:hypothetical protein